MRLSRARPLMDDELYEMMGALIEQLRDPDCGSEQ